jgi:hypothetical protein
VERADYSCRQGWKPGKTRPKVGMAGKSIPEFGRTPLASRFGPEAPHG